MDAIDFSKLKRAFSKLNKDQFDNMLQSPQFLTTTRGIYPIRYNGSNMYTVNLTQNVTQNDLIVEMCYHLYEEPHEGQHVMSQIRDTEAPARGYKLLEDTPVLFEAVEVKKSKGRLYKYTCENKCQIARGTNLDVTCNTCGKPMEKVE